MTREPALVRPGNGRRKTEFSSITTVALTPTPSASVSTATAVKPGFFSSWRKANLRSVMTQCLNRIDLRRAARGDPTSQGGDADQQHRNSAKRQRIGCTHTEELAADERRQCERGHQADGNSDQRKSQP